MVKITTILYALVVLGALPALANAAPTIDGHFDPAEGYSVGYWVKLEVEGGKKTGNIPADDGELWLYQNATSGDLFVNFTQPLTLVDNSYGDNAIGWGKGVAPSGKNHKFKDLKGSDKARFNITDGTGSVVLDFNLDYISKSCAAPSGFASLGPTYYGDGDDDDDDDDDDVTDGLLAWGTSLDYNFNSLGYVLTKDSPTTDEHYTENPNFPGWLFEVTYEFQVDGSLFTENGFGGLTIPTVHDSPNKIGKNKVYPQVDGVIPEPTAIVLLSIGTSLVGWLRRRKTL